MTKHIVYLVTRAIMAELKHSDKNVVFGYINQIQILLQSQNRNNPYFHIIKPLKELCLSYFTFKIDTTILTNDEILNFRDLLQRYNKLHLFNKYEWNLIYKASRDGLSECMAKEKYENKSNIICFIESENGNVLGGYTETGWTVPTGYTIKTKRRSCLVYGQIKVMNPLFLI